MFAVSILITAICWLINIIILALIIYSILSWLPISAENPIIVLLQTLTEPVVSPCRKLLKRFDFTMDLPIDLSPLLAFIALTIIQRILSMILVLI